jgi:diguanylate cyclase (GGDEF)-like protein
LNTTTLHPEAEDFDSLLANSHRHADAGQADASIAMASAAMAVARERSHGSGVAEAMLCIASVELRLQGRFAGALDKAQHAVALFREAQDLSGESRALSTVAIAATRLGYYESAVDAALLAIKLVDPLELMQLMRERVMAYHALGIAMFSGKCFVEASNAYQQAIALAQQCDPPFNAFELHSDLASTESYRHISERNAGGARLSLDMLGIYVNRCHELLAVGATQPSVAPGSHTNNLLISNVTEMLWLTWSGRLDEAEAALKRFRRRQEELNRPWLLAAVNWGHSELALARGDLEDAAYWAQEMVDVARHHHHEGLLSIGYQVLSHICEQAGNASGALAAMRLLVQREQAARAQSLKGRLEVIERQVEMRRQSQTLLRLENDTRLYQRLAMEDGLTGLANRRQFEQALQAALPQEAEGTPAPLCLATIDVDRFKQINDRHSHNTGDAVLRRIAGLLKSHTREDDLPARLAGDEFVILLRHSDLGVAEQVCGRLQDAVRDFDWAGLAPELQVTISIGLAAAQAGDTLEALMLRSDEQMYVDKRRGGA